jgi:hypothetical protein
MTNKLIEKFSSLICLITIYVVFIYFSQPVYGSEHTDDNNKYSGTEFDASSFEDTSFAKTDYRELQSTNSAGAQLVRDNDHFPEKKQKNQENKNDITSNISAIKDSSAKESNRITKEERKAPVKDLPGDWVPDKLDLTSNGGFGIAPDNGAPVPYRLNGHVDIQRGRPWAE